MCNDELLAYMNKEIDQAGWTTGYYPFKPLQDGYYPFKPLQALRAVVELIQEKQKFLENTKGDIPMTNQQLWAREERTKLLAEIKQAIEKELG